MTMGPEPMSRILFRSVRRGMCGRFLVIVRARDSVASHIMADTPVSKGSALLAMQARLGESPHYLPETLLDAAINFFGDHGLDEL